MGFFSKDKITLDQLTDALTVIVFNSISDDSLETYKILLKDMKESEAIDERQKREILILELLATTRAIQKIFNAGSYTTKILLDKLYSKVYSRISKIEAGQVKFEKFIHERYKIYYEILSSRSQFMDFTFGKQFTDYFLDKDVAGSGLALIYTVTDIFMLNIEETEKFIKELLSKYELKI